MVQMEKMYHDREIAHEAVVERVKQGVYLEEDIQKTARLFSVLADPVRLRIVASLLEGEMCVFHLLQVCEVSKSAMSHQLRILKDANIVRAKRFGKNVEYSISDMHIQEIVKTGFMHLHCKGD